MLQKSDLQRLEKIMTQTREVQRKVAESRSIRELEIERAKNAEVGLLKWQIEGLERELHVLHEKETQVQSLEQQLEHYK